MIKRFTASRSWRPDPGSRALARQAGQPPASDLADPSWQDPEHIEYFTNCRIIAGSLPAYPDDGRLGQRLPADGAAGCRLPLLTMTMISDTRSASRPAFAMMLS